MSNYGNSEVLSPAGSREMLIAAVRSGADAVYLGANEFSARRNAENFSADELKQVADYCRIRGVKTYLALNILIKDSEFSRAVKLAEKAYNSGIDGVIIEDLGLAYVLRRCLPELPLHASTQMSVHSKSALPFLKEMGFCRVVAGREMSADELRVLCRAAKALDMEVEVFVHGALCMSVSGQCLLSAFLGSRSGNRGLCAGPCRLPFKAVGGTGYDLSLKDLSLLPYLRELSEMGVTSFKIEGRMKRPEYAAAATAACRAALDTGAVPKDLERALGNVFSRSGFTDGYYTGKIGREMFGIRTKDDVTAAPAAFSELHSLYRSERRSVPVTAAVTVKENVPVKFSVCDGTNTAFAVGDIPQKAVNRAVTADELRQSAEKFGSTPYVLNKCDISLDDGLFVKASQLNELRRLCTDRLGKLRAADNRIHTKANFTPRSLPEHRTDRTDIYISVENEAQIPRDLSEICGLIYPLEKNIEVVPQGTLLAVDIPRGIISEDYISERLEYFKEKGFDTAVCGNLAAVVSAGKSGFKIFAGTGLNVFNSESAEVLSASGAEKILLSNEITLADAAKINCKAQKGITAYGKIPLMLLRNCPLKNGRKCENCDKKGFLTDRKGTNFRVRCRAGYSELLNSVPVWLADRKSDLGGIDFAVLSFTDETPERVSKVIRAYKNGCEPDAEYTRGLYYRGVL